MATVTSIAQTVHVFSISRFLKKIINTLYEPTAIPAKYFGPDFPRCTRAVGVEGRERAESKCHKQQYGASSQAAARYGGAIG